MTYVIKIFIKKRIRCLAEVECGKETMLEFDNQLKDDAITMLELGELRLPKESIKYVLIKEHK